jgi:hypothetical protein
MTSRTGGNSIGGSLAAVSPRKARRAAAEAPPAVRLGPPQTQTWPDGEWVVRAVPGAAASKTYRCPGCDQEIWPGVPHVVAWPEQAPGPAERRHWHNACWQRRPRRGGPGRGTHR